MNGYVSGGLRRPADGEMSDAWVDRLATFVLAAMLLYALLISLSGFNRAGVDQVSTDAVNPLNRFVWLGLLALAAPIALARWRAILSLLRASWPIVLLYIYFAASTSWALDPGTSARRLMFSVVQLLLGAILLSGIRRAATLHVLIAAICMTAGMVDLLSWVIWPGYAMTSEGLAGLQLQKNQTGLLMMYGCLSIGSGFFLFRGRMQRAMVGGALLMMLGLLVATRSTTSQSIVLLAPFVVPCVLLAARLRKPVIWSILVGMLALLAGLAACYLAWCGVVNADPLRPVRGITFTSRLDLWTFVLGEIGKRPWLGAGYSSFWAIDPAVQPSLKSDMWFGTYAIINEAHEGYLDLLATGGIVGLIGGLFVVFRTLGMALRAILGTQPASLAWRTGQLAYPTAAFHLSLLLALLVHNFTESNLFSNNSVLAVAFILAALDLEKWQLGTRLSRSVPSPRLSRPLAPARANPAAVAARAQP